MLVVLVLSEMAGRRVPFTLLPAVAWLTDAGGLFSSGSAGRLLLIAAVMSAFAADDDVPASLAGVEGGEVIKRQGTAAVSSCTPLGAASTPLPVSPALELLMVTGCCCAAAAAGALASTFPCRTVIPVRLQAMLLMVVMVLLLLPSVAGHVAPAVVCLVHRSRRLPSRLAGGQLLPAPATSDPCAAANGLRAPQVGASGAGLPGQQGTAVEVSSTKSGPQLLLEALEL
jgi:hypothetical protein